MAPKGSKRNAQAVQAQQQAAPEPKKPKLDPNVVGVVDAIRQAELPEECRAMLIAMAPSCFSTPVNKRHESQAVVASWIEQVLNGVRAKLQDALDEAETEAAGEERTKEGLNASVADAKAALSAGEETIAVKEASLAEAAQAVKLAEAAVRDAQEAQKQGEARLVEASKEKEALEAALKDDIQFLKDEEGFQAEQAAQRLEASLAPIAQRLGLEASLALALPAVCSRPPAERGPFDQKVLEQLEASIGGRLAELEGELQASASATGEHAAAITVAQDRVQAAEEERRVAAAEREEAEAQRGQLAASLTEAEAAAEAFTKGRGSATEAREEKAAALQNFTGYNIECFNLLCNNPAHAGA